MGGKRSREDSLHRCRRCTSGERARDDHQAVCLLTACRSCRLSRTQLCMPSSVRGGRRRRPRDEQVVELNDDERGAIDGTQRGRPEMTILALKSQRLLNLQSSFNHPPVSLFFLSPLPLPLDSSLNSAHYLFYPLYSSAMSPISSSPLLDLPPSPVLASALIASATASLALAAPLLKRADNIDTSEFHESWKMFRPRP